MCGIVLSFLTVYVEVDQFFYTFEKYYFHFLIFY